MNPLIIAVLIGGPAVSGTVAAVMYVQRRRTARSHAAVAAALFLLSLSQERLTADPARAAELVSLGKAHIARLTEMPGRRTATAGPRPVQFPGKDA